MPVFVQGPDQPPFGTPRQRLLPTEILLVKSSVTTAPVLPDLALPPPTSLVIRGANAAPMLPLAPRPPEPEAALLPPQDSVFRGANAPPVLSVAPRPPEPEAALLPPQDAVLRGGNARPVTPISPRPPEPELTALPPQDRLLSGANASPVLTIVPRPPEPELTLLPPEDSVLPGANAPPVLTLVTRPPEIALLPPEDLLVPGGNAPAVVPLVPTYRVFEVLLPPNDLIFIGSNTLPPVPPLPPVEPPAAVLFPGGGGFPRRSIEDFDPRFDDPECEDLDELVNEYWRCLEDERRRDASQRFAQAFTTLRRALEERDRHQTSLIGALETRLERETAQARVLHLAMAAGLGTLLYTKRILPALVATALGAVVGHVLFAPAPLRIYLWLTNPDEGPPRRLTEPVVLTDQEAAQVAKMLGPGTLSLVFDGVRWVPSPLPRVR